MFSMPTVTQDKRPPFLRFETRSKIDPVKSAEAGRQMYDDVVYAIVMQFGSKDQFEKEAVEWLAQKRKEAIGGNYPQEWVDQFERMYEAYTKGAEAPLHGTPLTQVPWLTPSRIKHWQAANIMTLEDMVAANEGVLTLVGMGARTERDQARAYIEAGKDQGAVAARVADLEQKLRDSEQAREDTNRKLEEMANRFVALESGKSTLSLKGKAA